jgi:hypothetical protein
MDQFKITVNDQLLIVDPMEDGTFIIWKDDEHLGVIFPANSVNDHIIWGSGDLISDEWTQAIGEAIERYEG